MNIAQIIKCDIANGTGIRLSIFVSGCTNHCKGCFQPETWDFNYGLKYDESIKKEIFDELSKGFYDGITLLGGDPMEECNQRGLLPLMREIKAKYRNLNLWVYTGFIYDKDLVPGGKRYFDITDEFLDMIDILVDGPFIESQRNLKLEFRGSENQRLIKLKKTRKSGNIIQLWEKR